MSLSSYDNLKEEIIDWSGRDDMDLNIDTFIDMAETEMYANDFDVLQIRDGEVRAAFSTSITDRFAALPTGYQSQRKMRIQIVNGESVELKFRTPAQLNILSAAGLPAFFTITDQIEFNRISDQVYSGEIQYFQDFTPLSSSNATNAVLTRFPNIYLFGVLWALKIKAEEPISADKYYQRFIGAIKGANTKDKLGRYGVAPIMRVEGSTP